MIGRNYIIRYNWIRKSLKNFPTVEVKGVKKEEDKTDK